MSVVVRTEWLSENDCFRVCRVPAHLLPDDATFEALWEQRPDTRNQILIHGRKLEVPRYERAFLRSYRYSGQTNVAASLPTVLTPLLSWALGNVEPKLNGVLVSWYEAEAGHYIGAHRDEHRELDPSAPIVGVSLGSTRLFRFRKYRGGERHDLEVSAGDVVIIPYETNLRWTHEVPRLKRYTGRRVAVTMRSFIDSSLER